MKRKRRRQNRILKGIEGIAFITLLASCCMFDSERLLLPMIVATMSLLCVFACAYIEGYVS